jgi:hypothetical protein
MRTLRAHNSLLDTAYHDARRLALSGRRPAYLLDFDLLFRYMLQSLGHPEWEQELHYLLGQTETTFIVGPGTTTEIDRFLARRGLNLGSDGHVRSEGGPDNDDGVPYRTQVAVVRLAELLRLPNICSYVSIVPDGVVYEPAYEVAKAALDKRRRRASHQANQADALNWAAVVHLRQAVDSLSAPIYPYLLTGTRSLLDERLWSDEIGSPISRHPAEAIYTELLLDRYQGNYKEAMAHTVRMSVQSSALENDLKTSPAQLDPDGYALEPEWERVVAEGRVSARLREQLQDLAEFVSDPVVREAQRIYDNARMATVSTIEQYGEIIQTFRETPSRLFDLIVGINAALRESDDGSKALSSLWSTVLQVDERQETDCLTTYTLTERNGQYEYLTVERHAMQAGENYFVFRWPSSLDATRVVDAFSRAFQRHDVAEVEAIVGASEGILTFDADIPCTFSELLDAVLLATDGAGLAQSASLEKDEADALNVGSIDARSFGWLRMDSEQFDLYADVVGRPPLDPVIGVFAESVDVGHVLDLYEDTSAHYVFRTWLERAICSML